MIWDQVETRALERDISAIAARGEPITVDTAPVGADTPERHDAARIYAAAAQRVREWPPDQRLNLWSVDVDSRNAPAIADLEAKYRPDVPVLQLVDQAAPLDFNGFGDVELESEEPFYLLDTLAGIRSDLYSARGRGDDAAASLFSAVRLQRTFTDSFYAPLVMGRVLGSLRVLLRHSSPSEQALARLQEAIEALPDTDSLVHDVQGRRAELIDRWSRPSGTISEAVLLRLLRPWITRSKRAQLRALDESMAVAREPWPAKAVSANALERKYEPELRAATQRGFFARIASPYSRAVAPLYVTGSGTYLAARRVAVSTLAVERYRRRHGGALPETLDALVPTYLREVPRDPFSGTPLIYRRTRDAYLVYSVDRNGKDDGGTFYGLGSKAQLNVQQGAPRDLGIRVDMTK